MYKLLWLISFLAIISTATSLTAEDDKENIQLLFASASNAAEIDLDETNSNILSPTKKTVFLVHGWLQNDTIHYYSAMFGEYMKKGGYDVIRVNWEKYSMGGYLTAKKSVERVGNFIGKFIDHIHKNNGIYLDNVHIVGHSLGAHIGGFAGQAIKSLSGPIGRISGLDPAGPAFDYLTPDTRKLDATDAKVVDNVYTNRGIFGTTDVLGTINFYANGATFQPGCPFVVNNKTGLFCSHLRSTSLFTESINSNKFVAIKISNFLPVIGPTGKDKSVKVIFGENTNATAGKYYFETNSEEPYALG